MGELKNEQWGVIRKGEKGVSLREGKEWGGVEQFFLIELYR